MTGVFSETGFGGVYYGTQPYKRKHREVERRLRDTGIEISPTLSRNIGTVTQSCTEQLAEIQGEGREPIIQECNQWLDDTLKAHFTVEQMLTVQGIDNPWQYFLLPEVDWIGDLMKYSPIALEAMEKCIEIEECRLDYKRIAWGLIEGFVRGTFWLTLHGVAAGTRRAYGGQKIVTDVKLGWRLYNLFNDFKFATSDIWNDYRTRKQSEKSGADPVRESYSYYNLEHGEDRMPYNRRTGQWYPARRFGSGTYNRRYRRYGNTRYSGGYSPRRRRTYRRW